jgi:5'-methylthioadenosine phosphorylase
MVAQFPQVTRITKIVMNASVNPPSIGPISIGLIGGSGLYEMADLTERQLHEMDTPFGRPSDPIVTGKLAGVPVAFLARHGKGHRLIPSEVPYRANIYALKLLGVRYIVSISAVGSMREELRPVDMVLPDQYIDLTRRREGTFFGNGAVAHVSMARPVCAELLEVLARAVEAAKLPGVQLHRGGSYVCIEGPTFSTLAESLWYRSMNVSIIGMTAMPEAKLAREAQIAYATLALVTDYDCWHPHEAHVTADMAFANLMKNAANAQRVVINLVKDLHAAPPVSSAHTALTSALVTQPEQMRAEVRERLRALL